MEGYNAVYVGPLIQWNMQCENDFVLSSSETIDALKQAFGVNNTTCDPKQFDPNCFNKLKTKSIGLIGNTENLIKFFSEKFNGMGNIYTELKAKDKELYQGLFLIILKNGNNYLFAQFLLCHNLDKIINEKSQHGDETMKILQVFLRILTKFNQNVLLLLNQNDVAIYESKEADIEEISYIEVLPNDNKSIFEIKLEKEKIINFLDGNYFDQFILIPSHSKKLHFMCVTCYTKYAKFLTKLEDLKEFIKSKQSIMNISVKLNLNDLNEKNAKLQVNNININDIEYNEILMEKKRRNFYLILHAFSKAFVVEFECLEKQFYHLGNNALMGKYKEHQIIFTEFLQNKGFLDVNNEDEKNVEVIVQQVIDENKLLLINQMAAKVLISEIEADSNSKASNSLGSLLGKDRHIFFLKLEYYGFKKFFISNQEKISKLQLIQNSLNEKMRNIECNRINAKNIFENFFEVMDDMIAALKSNPDIYFTYTCYDRIKENLRERKSLQNNLATLINDEREEPSRILQSKSSNPIEMIINGLVIDKDTRNLIILCSFENGRSKHEVYTLNFQNLEKENSVKKKKSFERVLSENFYSFMISESCLLTLCNKFQSNSNRSLETQVTFATLSFFDNDCEETQTISRPFNKADVYARNKKLALLNNDQNSLSISILNIITECHEGNFLEYDDIFSLNSYFKPHEVNNEFLNNIQIRFETSNPILWINISEKFISINTNTRTKTVIDIGSVVSSPLITFDFVLDSTSFIVQSLGKIYCIQKKIEENEITVSTFDKLNIKMDATEIQEDEVNSCLYFIHYSKDKDMNKLRIIKSTKINLSNTTENIVTSTVGESETRKTLLSVIISSFKTYPIQHVLEEKLKQPCHLTLIQMSENQIEHSTIREYFKRQIEELNNKLVYSDDFFHLKMISYNEVDDTFLQQSFKNSPEIQVNNWINMFLTILPIKVLKLENNEIKLIQYNKVYAVKKKEMTVSQLSDEMNFEYLEGVINKWEKNVKVVTSMGRQSTGKSYYLNHLLDVMLTSSPKRCTTGCYMTIRIKDDCLYVVFDFEAFETLARSSQEDTMLAMLNFAITNLCLFKSERAGLDKGIINLITNTYSQYSKIKWSNCIDLFHGQLVFIINDVDRDDEKPAAEEFSSQINYLKKRIMKSLCTAIKVWPSPNFQTRRFQNSFKQCFKNNIFNKSIRSYKNGRVFMENYKLLLASMIVQDYTRFDIQKFRKRVKYIEFHIENALCDGTLNDGSPLIIMETCEKIDNCLIIILKEGNTIILEDDENNFSCEFFDKLEGKFLTALGVVGFMNMRNFVGDFNQVLQKVLDFRKEKCKKWIESNLELFDFEECETQRNEFNEKLKNWKEKTMLFFKLCDIKCDECYASCILMKTHLGKHTCKTNHKCIHLCAYCRESKTCDKLLYHEKNINDKHVCDMKHPCKNTCKYNGKIPCNDACAFEMDHMGDHQCEKKDHECRATCKYAEDTSYDCKEKCWRAPDHEGDHLCNKPHSCVKKCSLETCNKNCEIKDKFNHECHKCGENVCVEKCKMQTCKDVCYFPHHFHCNNHLLEKYVSENQEKYDLISENKKVNWHICDSKHRCTHKCNALGYCRQEKVIGSGVIRSSKGSKEDCHQLINPHDENHEGGHLCNNTVHYCMDKCPTCGSLCEEKMDHTCLHSTKHTNMVNHISGKTTMCDVYCTERDRGHLHVVKSLKQLNEIGKKYQDLDSTESNKLQTIQQDLSKLWVLTHNDYWKYIKFKDPCSTSNDYNKCNYTCPSVFHETPVFCVSEKFHQPLQTDLQDHYISKDGHMFKCIEPKFHFYFCVDDSGSMLKDDRRKLAIQGIKTFVYRKLAEKYNDLVTFINFGSDAIKIDQVSDLTSCRDFILKSKDEMAAFRSWVRHSHYKTSLIENLKLLQNLVYEGVARQPENYHLIIIITDGYIHGDQSNNQSCIEKIVTTGKRTKMHLFYLEDGTLQNFSYDGVHLNRLRSFNELESKLLEISDENKHYFKSVRKFPDPFPA